MHYHCQDVTKLTSTSRVSYREVYPGIITPQGPLPASPQFLMRITISAIVQACGQFTTHHLLYSNIIATIPLNRKCRIVLKDNFWQWGECAQTSTVPCLVSVPPKLYIVSADIKFNMDHEYFGTHWYLPSSVCVCRGVGTATATTAMAVPLF